MAERHRRAAVLVLVMSLAGAGCGTRVHTESAPKTGGGVASGGQSVVSAEPVSDAATADSPAASVDASSSAGTGVASGGSSAGAVVPPAAQTAGRAAPQAAAPSQGQKPGQSAPGGAQSAAGPTDSPAATAPSAPGGGGVQPPASKRSPVILGTVGPRNGPVGAALEPAYAMLQTWVRYVNENGGMGGHPVQLIIGDDGGDPARHRSILQEFVERRGVIAFLQNFESFASDNSREYLVSKGIPLVGADGGSDVYYDSPLRFPQAPTGDTLLQSTAYGIAQRFLPMGKKKLAVFTCVELAACKRASALYEQYGKEAGLEVVYKTEGSIAQPDYTAECLNARRAGAEIQALYTDPQTLSRFAQSCARQGYKPAYAIPAQALDGGAHPKNPNLDGTLYVSTIFPYVLDSTPATAEFQMVMRKYLPGAQPTGQHALAWVAGKLLERAAGRLSEPPTPASVVAGLHTVKNDDLGGLTYPLTFTAGQPAPRVACWFNVTITDGKVAALDGGKRTCH